MIEVTIKVVYDELPENSRASFGKEFNEALGVLWSLQVKNKTIDVWTMETSLDFNAPKED